ncbi:ATP-dependent helicase SGS1 [Nakaseomyces bracarensis]|uniref:DNA 3'-5' helicase n=1 Tax=Nakaseomyces bracarensis TaxID=273131 RepID=A0ABR4NPC3_9SACH
MVTKPSNNLRREHKWLKETNVIQHDIDIVLKTLEKTFQSKRRQMDPVPSFENPHAGFTNDSIVQDSIEIIDDDDEIIFTNYNKSDRAADRQSEGRVDNYAINAGIHSNSNSIIQSVPVSIDNSKSSNSTNSRILSTFPLDVAKNSNSSNIVSDIHRSEDLPVSKVSILVDNNNSNNNNNEGTKNQDSVGDLSKEEIYVNMIKVQDNILNYYKELNNNLLSKCVVMESTSLSEDNKKKQIQNIINPKIERKLRTIKNMEIELEGAKENLKKINSILDDITNVSYEGEEKQHSNITFDREKGPQGHEEIERSEVGYTREHIIQQIPSTQVSKNSLSSYSVPGENNDSTSLITNVRTQTTLAVPSRPKRMRQEVNYRIPELDESFDYRVGVRKAQITSDDTTFEAEDMDRSHYLTTQEEDRPDELHESDIDFIEDNGSEISHDTDYQASILTQSPKNIHVILSSPSKGNLKTDLAVVNKDTDIAIDYSDDSIDITEEFQAKQSLDSISRHSADGNYINNYEVSSSSRPPSITPKKLIDDDEDDWREIENFSDEDLESFDEERENKTKVEEIEEFDNELQILTERKIEHPQEEIPVIKKENNNLVILEEQQSTSLTDDELEDDISLLGVIEEPQVQELDMTPIIPNGNVLPWKSEVMKKLKDVFKLDSFRSNQEEAVNATLSGKDVFVLMPTGGGKSLCYQLPAIVQSGKTRGTTIVISPLISLMQDQVEHLRQLNIEARMLSSKGALEEKNHTFNLFIHGFLDLIYLSPEMISVSEKCKSAIDKLYHNKQLARIVVDEAHCVSNWGHDFRPDYKQLSYFKTQYPDIPMMALTATASEQVQMDIVYNLKLKQNVFLRQSFNRTNLYYEVKKKDKNAVFEMCDTIKTRFRNQTGIIYCHSKNSCEQTSQLLKRNGIKCAYYHAGMEPEERLSVQQQWQADNIQVICATVAFGMGIDKGDVRFVYHFTVPRTLEGYYQETGRAGRDGKYSICITYYSFRDVRTMQTMIQKDKNLDRENKQKHLDKLQQVTAYCENDTDCRRKLVLSYFSEDFDPQMCHKNCDNCRNTNNIIKEERDVTKIAQEIGKLVNTIQNDRVTMIYCQNVFKGSRNSKIVQAGHDLLPQHGAGKDLSKSEIERIFFHLITKRVLQEYSKVNNAGFSSSYVKTGENYWNLLNGKLSVKIHFSVSEGNSRSSTKSLDRKNNINHNTKRTTTEFATEFADGHLKNFAYNSAVPEPIRLVNEGDMRTTQELGDLKYAYQRLKETSLRWGSRMTPAVNNFLQDISLRKLATILPASEKEFGSVVGPNSNDSKKYKYFKDILHELRMRRIDIVGNRANSSLFMDEEQSQIDTLDIQPAATSKFFSNSFERPADMSVDQEHTSTQYSGKKPRKNYYHKRYGKYRKRRR